MRRRAISVAVGGVGVLAARALAPKLHARLIAGCERMFDQMPDSFPPKRMLEVIEEIRANSVRTLALLEEREQAGKAEMLSAGSPTREGAARLGTTEEREPAVVGASSQGSAAQGGEIGVA